MQELKKLEVLLSKNKISRREFLAKASALGLTAAMAPTFWPGRAKASTPKIGGVLRIGMGHGATTDSLDPAVSNHAYTSTLQTSYLNHLLEIGPDGGLVPKLVESWEPSADLKTWTFKLRKGVEFHNGKTLDANDVVATINHHRSEKSKSAVKSFLKNVTDLKAAEKNVFMISLEQPHLDFPYVMTSNQMQVLPAKGDGVDWQSGNGTGPYKLINFEPGVRATLERNPNYWQSGRGNFDSVELLVITDGPARANALRTGTIDVMDRCDPKTVGLLAKVPGIKIQEVTGTAHYTLPMRTDVAPFNDNNVRMALKLAMDRKAMLANILQGHGAIGNDHPISPADYFFADKLPQRAYDPDKARFYLKKAGYDKLTVKLHAADAAFKGAVDLAIVYKEQAAKAGINIEVVREPNDGYWKSVWMKKSWCFCYWLGRPTADWMFTTAYAADASWNDTFWKNDRFNKLLIGARTEVDKALRREMYTEMQSLVRDDGGTVVPLFNNYLFASNDKLQHGPLHSSASLDGYMLPELWWY
jgi:peptide/nickel transport system substrate-binding protein